MVDPIEPSDTGASAGPRPPLIAGAAAGVFAILLLAFVVWWWRRGGARRAVTRLAEDGAVRLADVIVEEVLGAA